MGEGYEGAGGETFPGAQAVAQVLAAGKGGPRIQGRDCGAARPRPSSRQGSFCAATRLADPATRARTRPGRRERGLVGMGEAKMRTVGKRRVPPRRPLGSGGA